MKLLEYFLTTAAFGYAGFKALNWVLLRSFFSGTLKRVEFIREQRDLVKHLVYDLEMKRGPVRMRVLYSDRGL